MTHFIKFYNIKYVYVKFFYVIKVTTIVSESKIKYRSQKTKQNKKVPNILQYLPFNRKTVLKTRLRRLVYKSRRCHYEFIRYP